jgi:hypothetical protein
MKHIIFLLVTFLCGIAPAQQKPAKAHGPAAPVISPSVTVETVYPLPLAERDKFRDLQHENDAIEIENQRMLVKIEQNKARQATLVDQEMAIASQFGREKNLDLGQYELDPAPVALRKKKAK